jgi:hypothetical protein
LSRVESFGWQLVKRETYTQLWWADETWVLESTWSPVGYKIHLTFFVDPEWHGNRKTGEGVWAIKASRNSPTQWQDEEGEILMVLGRGWLKQLPQFVSDLSALRDEYHDEQR